MAMEMHGFTLVKFQPIAKCRQHQAKQLERVVLLSLARRSPGGGTQVAAAAAAAIACLSRLLNCLPKVSGRASEYAN